MTLIDLLRSPWAIIPDRLDEIQAVYATHFRGEKIDIAAIEARLGQPLANEQKEYSVESGGVGLLELSGAISPKANIFTRVCGGASAEMFAAQVDSMRNDPRVRSVVLNMDTPGGNVLGIPAAAAAVRALAEAKPTVTVSTGMLASAGYWIGSASNAVYASGQTDMIGSIGVVARHTYDPKSAAVQTTEVTAGKYKRIASDTGPLTKEGRAYMQAQVDEIYRVFVDTVAQNRRASVNDVLSRMADGRIFVGQQALEAGLIDGFATVNDMVERLATNPDAFAKRRKATFALGGLPTLAADASAGVIDAVAQEICGDGSGVALPAIPAGAAEPAESEAGPVLPAASETPHEDHTMTPQEAAAKFAADNPQAAAALRADGAAAEQARIAAVRAQVLPGHEALIDALVADGKTTGPEAAMAVLAAEKARVAAAGKARLADGQAPLPTASAESDPKPPAAPAARKPMPTGARGMAALNNPAGAN